MYSLLACGMVPQPATLLCARTLLGIQTLFILKNGAPWDVMLCHVALVTTNVSEECIASIIRVTRIGKLGTTLAVTSNRSMLPKKCYGVTSQKTAFFIATTVRTSNLLIFLFKMA
jgi:hypothetical protein